MYPDAPPREGRLIGIYVALFSVATTVVVVRLFARARTAFISADDGMIVLAWAMILGVLVAAIIGCKQGGWGYHLTDLTPDVIAEGLKQEYVFMVLFNPAMLATRLSILLFYRRINPEKRFRLVVHITCAFSIGAALGAGIPFIFQCRPVRYFWDRTIPGGRCYVGTSAIVANAAISMTNDIFILLIPIPMVWRLRIPRKQKIALSAVFTVGIFTCVSSCIRLYYIQNVVTPDPLWDGVLAGVWTYVEIVSAIICACLPALRGLMTSLRSSSALGRSSRPSDYVSWSNHSRHRRLAVRDDDGSHHKLFDEFEMGKHPHGSPAVADAVVLEQADRKTSIPLSSAPISAPVQAVGYQNDEVKNGSDLVVPPPARIQVNTSISVQNTSKQ